MGIPFLTKYYQLIPLGHEDSFQQTEELKEKLALCLWDTKGSFAFFYGISWKDGLRWFVRNEYPPLTLWKHIQVYEREFDDPNPKDELSWLKIIFQQDFIFYPGKGLNHQIIPTGH